MLIRAITVDEPQVLALLRVHLEGMHASSPPGTVYALDTSGLSHPAISFLGAFDDDTLLGFGALKALGESGEVKSMRTHADHLRKGVAAWYQKTYGITYKPEQVVVSNGAKHSLHNALACTVGPGDEVIIPTPYWVSYSDLVQMTGARFSLVPT